MKTTEQKQKELMFFELIVEIKKNYPWRKLINNRSNLKRIIVL